MSALVSAICTNCGKHGHFNYNCKHPITSYGVIPVMRSNEDGQLRYLMICRRNSFGYLGFLNGKYTMHNHTQIQGMFDEMTLGEKHDLMTCDFSTLWRTMWGDDITNDSPMHKKQNLYSSNNIAEYVSASTTRLETPEWEFTKGRRTLQEKESESAVREFEEESGYSRRYLHLVDNLLPIEEIFIGTDNRPYKHKYFVGRMYQSEIANIVPAFQKSEVSQIAWFTYDQARAAIRPYQHEKLAVLQSVHELMSSPEMC